MVPNRRRDGSPFLNELSLSPLTEPSGEVRHCVAVQRDVTSRVEAQTARDVARAEAATLSDQLQRQLVPHRLPVVPGPRVAVRYQPATREADAVADAVLTAVARHVGDGPTDDLTLMVLHRTA